MVLNNKLNAVLTITMELAQLSFLLIIALYAFYPMLSLILFIFLL